jgi:hypothetical protein
MRNRFVAASAALAVAFGIQSIMAAQSAPARPPAASARPVATSAPPRMGNGHPDLSGDWSFATITPLQRPVNLGTKATYTPEEAAALEKQAAVAAVQDEGRQKGTAADVNRAYNDAWYDRGTKVVGTKQTSLIVDPPNGRIPPLTPAAQARQGRGRGAAVATGNVENGPAGPADGPEARSLGERCILGFNAGPPFLSSAYNNNITLVTTADYAVIETEMVHNARIVSLTRKEHLPSSIRQWMGDSIGHWEGDTLVVETTNFSEKNIPQRATTNVKLIEKFTRTGPDSLTYEFTLIDPATWTAPWTARVPMDKLPSDERVYEYACHEANYGMEGILKGARADEKNAAAGK